ncbi:hypothetical protein UFOVP785_11 [uncultured Caudovirales phage]|uniref:Uncharacterized protein n=1 Tax=uncultured Caudovirales phage TaxID=2100421 RepID=A0A6J5NQN3_9CAUD|nr:hypothetical protein UFOVP785_11 [uncultured Caudovirales phage]
METREQFIERLRSKKLLFWHDGEWAIYTSKYGYSTAEKQRWIADELDRLNAEAERDRLKLIEEWKNKRSAASGTSEQIHSNVLSQGTG